jgi:integrase
MARIVSSADEPLGTICFVLGSTGMRIGEVLALRIEDLDFQRRLAHIRLRFSRVLWAHQRVKRAWPRCRCCSIWRSVSRGFLASKHYRQNSQGLLFATRRGRPFSANKLRETKLRPLLSSLGIPRAGFHAFRHGVATTLIDSGASITTVGTQLRDSDPRITVELYAHVVPQSQRDAVEGLASALGSGQRGLDR